MWDNWRPRQAYAVTFDTNLKNGASQEVLTALLLAEIIETMSECNQLDSQFWCAEFP